MAKLKFATKPTSQLPIHYVADKQKDALLMGRHVIAFKATCKLLPIDNKTLMSTDLSAVTCKDCLDASRS